MKSQTTVPNQTSITSATRHAIYMNRMVKSRLGSSYSWDGELYYQGNPCVYWATDHEQKVLASIERNWHEATTI